MMRDKTCALSRFTHHVSFNGVDWSERSIASDQSLVKSQKQQ
jgi:hypothetical protein